MAKKEEQMCPLYPDINCPRGHQAVEECTVRFNGNFDPVADFRDLLVMHCALHRTHQQKKKELQKQK